MAAAMSSRAHVGGAAAARRRVPLAGGQGLRQAHEQILGVPVVAEDRVGQAGCLDRLFRLEMIRREADLRGIGNGQRGVGEPFRAGLGRRGDGCLVLTQPRAGAVERIGRDDQHGSGSRESLFKTCRIVEIGLAHGDALGCEVGELVGVARAGDDARCRNALRQQVIHDGAAEMAGGAGDENRVGHCRLFLLFRFGICSRNETISRLVIAFVA